MTHAFTRSSGGRSAVLAPVVLALAGLAHAQTDTPPTPDLNNWKGPRNNCYNYAIDSKTNDFKQPGGLPWPNVGANLTAAQWCTKVQGRAVGDGLAAVPWAPGQPIPTPPAGFNLVALGSLAGVKGGGGDYHWWRLNGDGTWSHKRGQTAAKTTYTDNTGAEQPLTDPRAAAQTDGYTICGFLGVPKNPPPAPHIDPGLTPPSGGVRTWRLRTAGYEDTILDFLGPSVGALQAHLPDIVPANQVPDPNWIEPRVPAFRGFSIMPGPGITGFPPYMRVFEGVVAVYFELEGLEVFYFADNRGLADFLTPSSCYANCDQSTLAPCLNVIDFACFLNAFASGNPYANCDASTTPPVLNVLDFACFLNQFAAGCSAC